MHVPSMRMRSTTENPFWYHQCMDDASLQHVLDRVLDPFADCLTTEVALKIVDLRADPETQTRLDALADKANEGLLSEDERAEYAKLREAFHFVTILQAKARAFLDRQAAA
jgi:hypothetical protein